MCRSHRLSPSLNITTLPSNNVLGDEKLLNDDPKSENSRTENKSEKDKFEDYFAIPEATRTVRQ